MIRTDYPTEALAFLLDEACLMQSYAPLIPRRDALIAGLRGLGCVTKSDAGKLTDGELIALGLPDAGTVRLFRRFLALYDPRPAKFRELSDLRLDPERQAAYRELYHLPGVKEIRAELYFRAGFRTLAEIAASDEKTVTEKTARVIAAEGLSCVVPLPKEVRTHLAVARAFTMN